MVQVGTMAFKAGDNCNPTTVTFLSAPMDWMKTIGEAAAALGSYTDGYRMMMEVTVGASITADARTGTCI